MAKSSLIFKATLAILLMVCLVTIYVPQTIYFAQREYFAGYFISLIEPPLLYGLLAVGVISLSLILLPQKLLKFLASILLVFSLLMWIQVEYFTVSYGALDGSVIDFDQFDQRGYIELAVYGSALFIALFLHKFILKQLPFLVLLVLIGQLAITSINVYQEPKDKELAENMDEEFFNYSSDKNIILIVLDTFGSEYFKQAIIQDPTITTKLKGFVGYTDAISNYPATKGSVPSFLTGKMIPEDDKYKNFLTDYVANFGLPQMFNDKGYLVSVISVYSWFKPFFKDRFISQPQLSQETLKSYYSAQLLDYSLFRTLPHVIKPKIFNQGEWFTSEEVSKKAKIPNSFPEKGNFFLDLMTEKVTVSDPTPRFKMIHVTTPHPEYKFNRECELSQFPAGKHAMLEQSMCALKKLDGLLNKYKQQGIYDNSLIVVTSDHGSRIMSDKSLTGFPSYFEMNTSAILFMIKGIGQIGDFKQATQPFSLLKLYDAMLDEASHLSQYDSLQDNNRLFYSFRNHLKSQKGYMPDAPLFEVGSNARDPDSWQLKKFVTHKCKPQSIPLKMTFNTNEREGYCSIFGFSKPHTKKSGSWTESVDSRIILELEQSQVKVDDTYKIVLDFSPYFAGEQKSIKLKVMINDVAVGEQLITTKGNQTISFNFEGSLIHLSEQTVIQLLMPDLKSPKQMFLNNNTQKLGLLMRSIEVKRFLFSD